MAVPDTRQPDKDQIALEDTGQPDTGQLYKRNVQNLSLMANGSADARKISDLFAKAYQVDPFTDRILGLSQNGTTQYKEISLADCKERNSRLVYCDCIYIPDHIPLRLQLLQGHHDPLAIGYPG
jgi:hypothetical protein